MNSMLSTAMSIGPMALLAALLSVPIYYLTYRYAPEPKKRLSAARYCAGSRASSASDRCCPL
jgi:hypothetical protein